MNKKLALTGGLLLISSVSDNLINLK